MDPAAELKARLGDEPEMLRQASRLLYLHTTDMLSTDPAVRGAAVQRQLSREPLKVSGDRLGPYRVLSVLGEGGMGRVYLAERDDGEVERQVAIKVIAGRKSGPGVLERFLAERQILAGLDHANIARMFDAGTTDDGRSFLVMEPVDGLPIDRFCVQQSYSLKERLALFRKVAAAVAHAHQRLVVHRDLKPSNILVDHDGEPKLLDFGIAKLVDPSTGMESSRTGPAMTPKWASPEQLRGEVVTTATDVYSLGLLLYKLVTGRLPHDPDISLMDLARRTYEKDAPTRPSRHLEDPQDTAHATWPNQDLKKIRRRLQGDLDNIILKALRHDPTERYSSVEALIDDLRRLDAGEPVSATRGSFVYLAKKFVGRNRWPVAMVLMALLFGAGLFVVQEQKSREVRAEARRTEIANAFLADLFGDADARTRAGKTVDLRSMLDAGVERIRNDEIKDPQVRAQILSTLGKSYSDLSLWDEALDVFGEAEQLVRKLGLNLSLASILAKKSRVLIHVGRFDLARSTIAEAYPLSSPDLKLFLEDSIAQLMAAKGEFTSSTARGRIQLVRFSEQGDISYKKEELLKQLYWWAAILSDLGFPDQASGVSEDIYRIDSSNGFRGILRTLDAIGRPFWLRTQWAKCSSIHSLALAAHEDGRSHRDSTDHTVHLFLAGRCYGRSNQAEKGLTKVNEAIQRTHELLEKSQSDIRSHYQIGLGHQYRAMVHEEMGNQEARDEDLQTSREVFERLLKDHDDIIFIHNAYAMTLMMQGEIEKAKPIVEKLLWQGWRRPDFFKMAESTGALPDFVPPQLEIDTELPPKIREYIDSLPEVPLPWEEGFNIDDWKRPDG